MVACHGFTYSCGVMILFKPKINVSIGDVIRDKNGRYILSEKIIDDLKFI